jgi:hypothetical protein
MLKGIERGILRMTDERLTNWYVRIVTIIIGLLLVIIVVYNFFVAENGSITSGLVTIIVLLLVLALSESFDDFSVFNIITMKKKIREKDKSIDVLKTENLELRQNIIHITANVNQRQSSTNIFGFSEEILKKFGVKQATDAEVDENSQEESKEEVQVAANGITSRKRLDYRKIDAESIKRYIELAHLQEFNLIKDAKLYSAFDGIDPISDIQPIFDGYIKSFDTEFFLEVRPISMSPIHSRDRIYSMLNKLYYYNKICDRNVVFILILADFDRVRKGNFEYNSERYIEKLKGYFAPAITSGLLRIKHMEFTKEESEDFYVQTQR